MVIAVVIASMLVVTPPSLPSDSARIAVHYTNGCPAGTYPVTQFICCPHNTYLTDDNRCQYQSDGSGIVALLIVACLIALCWESEETDDDKVDLSDFDIDHDTFDPAKLLSDLEARAPAHLSETEKVEWAAREGARLIAEGRRRP